MSSCAPSLSTVQLQEVPSDNSKVKRSTSWSSGRSVQNKPRSLASGDAVQGKKRTLLKRYGEQATVERGTETVTTTIGVHINLNQATPQTAWELLEHTPATEPIHLSVLEAKAAEYLSKRRLAQPTASRMDVVVSKSGEIMKSTHDASDPVPLLESHQMLVEVTRENRRTFYQGFHISLPTSFARRQFIRTTTDTEFLLSDPETNEVVMSFPLPMVAFES